VLIGISLKTVMARNFVNFRIATVEDAVMMPGDGCVESAVVRQELRISTVEGELIGPTVPLFGNEEIA
jgi:hypothetical protein